MESPDLLLSCSAITVALHITIILIITNLPFQHRYPGNFETVSELELMVWASYNKDLIDRKIMNDSDIPLTTQIYRAIYNSIDPIGYSKAMKVRERDEDQRQD